MPCSQGGRRDEVLVRPDVDRSINADDLTLDRRILDISTRSALVSEASHRVGLT
jgi:hypothetical protein